MGELMSRAGRSPAWTETVVVPSQFQVTTLGPPVRVYPSLGGVSVGWVFIVFGGVLLATAVVLAITVNPFACIVPGLVGIIITIPGVANVLVVHAGSADAVVQYEDGFAAQIGKRVIVFPWEEIASVVSNVVVSKKGTAMSTYRITHKSGETVTLNTGIAEVKILIQPIKEHAHALLFPAMQKAYDQGETLTFGVVTVNREEIAAKGRRVSWSGVATAVIESGDLIVKPKSGEPLEVHVSQIPNVEQLAALTGIELSEYMLAR